MIDLAPYIRPGDGVWWMQNSGESTPLVHALLDQVASIGAVDVFCGMTLDRRLCTELPEQISVTSYGALGELRRLSQAGRLDIVPCNYSALPRLFAERKLPGDVGFLQVSPPDEDGLCSLGVAVDYAADALLHTPILIAEINQQMPTTRGSVRLPVDRFAAVIETDRPLIQAPDRAPDEVDRAIADNVAGLVENGDTLQLGVGPLPAAVADSLSGHRDLAVHSGLISDGIVGLIRSGVVTGAHKKVDRGTVVTGSALGRTAMYAELAGLDIEFKAASYTHAPWILGQLDTLVAINSAIEVDLTGQVGSEMRRGVYVGAVGGQVDFSHAAATHGGRSIIAIRANSGPESTIRAKLQWGPATTGRSDVDFVVTEYGVASLRGASLGERARRLLAIAAPPHRDALERAHRSPDPSNRTEESIR